MKSKKRQGIGLSLKATTALIIIVFMFGFGGTMWYYAIHKVVHVQMYDIRLEVVDEKRIGFNADPTLDFGKLPAAGGKAMKELKLLNEKEYPLLVRLSFTGEVARFIDLAENEFVLEPGELRKLPVYTIVSPGTEPGVYKGKAKITFLKE